MRLQGKVRRCTDCGARVSVSLESITALLRYHPDGGYGDPYTFVATCVIDGHVATLKGAMGEYTPHVRREIAKALSSIGVRTVMYERRNAGGRRSFARDTAPTFLHAVAQVTN